jgi:hydroxymethylbilane synthase
VRLVEIQTEGDLVRDRSLSAIGGQGVFTKEIQRALLDEVVDLAVHSLKDLPTFAVEGLTLAAVPQRGPTGDAFVSLRHPSFEEMPEGAVVATSSLRRRAQILHRRPDLRLIDIRGNVDTRLRKLEQENLDAIILAEAGLVRLGLDKRITQILHAEWMLPAVGQGALGLECRTNDEAIRQLLAGLNDEATHQAVRAERAMLRGLGGGCHTPIGAHAVVAEGSLTLRGVVLSPDGKERVFTQVQGQPDRAEEVGEQAARNLREQGADVLLEL